MRDEGGRTPFPAFPQNRETANYAVSYTILEEGEIRSSSSKIRFWILGEVQEGVHSCRVCWGRKPGYFLLQPMCLLAACPNAPL